MILGGVRSPSPRPEDDVDDGDRRQDRPHHEPVAETREDGEAGDVLGDADGERVEERAREAGAGTDQGNGAPCDLVVSEPLREDHQGGQEDERLLGHADGPAAEREQHHQHTDDDLAVAAAGANDAVDHGLDRSRRVDHRERAADQEDVEDDAGGLEEALWKGQEDLGDARRTRLDPVVGGGVHHLPVLAHDAVERARRDPVGGGGGDDDQPEEQGEGVRDTELHDARPQNSSAQRA